MADTTYEVVVVHLPSVWLHGGQMNRGGLKVGSVCWVQGAIIVETSDAPPPFPLQFVNQGDRPLDVMGLHIATYLTWPVPLATDAGKKGL